MIQKEEYFAYMEHEGQIELAYWAKTKKEAENKAKEWAEFSAKHNEENVSFGVAKIIEEIEYIGDKQTNVKDSTKPGEG